MVLQRGARGKTLGPPTYHPESTAISLKIYFGGTLFHTPAAKYIGGDFKIADYVDTRTLTLPDLKHLAKDFGIGKECSLQYFTIRDNYVRHLTSTEELRSIATQHIPERELSIFTCVGQGLQGDGNQDDSAADSDYSVDGGGDDSEDDKLFEEYVDKGIEIEEECEAERVLEEDVISKGGGTEGTDDFIDGWDGEGDEDWDEVEDESGTFADVAVQLETEAEKRGEKIRAEGDDSEASEETHPEDKYVDSDKDFEELFESDEENGNSYCFPTFNPVDFKQVQFEIGMVFITRDEFKQAVHTHAITNRRSVTFTKTDKKRVYAKCADDTCQWRINALKMPGESTFQVAFYTPKHSCQGSHNVKNMKSMWLAQKYLSAFKHDPKRNLLGWRLDVCKEMEVNISISQIYRAKRRAMEKLEGDPNHQYGVLWDYVNALRTTNPGSTVILGVDEANVFERIYICFGALKAGFRAGCRPVIGVDGCHLKGQYGGVLLTAIGIDPSNNYYPIAYAVVSGESGETWGWFLRILRTDLDIGAGAGYTFMSDKQKGLIQAFAEVLPEADHRFCVRHLQGNFRNAGFRGLSLKMALWRAARASTVGEFYKRMQDIKEMDAAAYEWLTAKPASQWSMSHFSDLPKCDMLLNNLCESFNNSILNARGRPILAMLECIRDKLMQRLQENRDRAKSKWRNKRICPKILKILQQRLDNVAGCLPMKSTDVHYQISCPDGSQHCVDLEKGTCSCRRWQVSGIPCRHALSAICNQKANPEHYVHHSYSVDTYLRVYTPAIQAVSSDEFWERTGHPPPKPPVKVPTGVGRPVIARRKGPDEPNPKVKKKKGSLRLKRYQTSVSCTRCGEPGHNIRACPDGPQPLRVRRKRATRTEELPVELDIGTQTSRTEADGLTGPTTASKPSKASKGKEKVVEGRCAKKVTTKKKKQLQIGGTSTQVSTCSNQTEITSTNVAPSMWDQLHLSNANTPPSTQNEIGPNVANQGNRGKRFITSAALARALCTKPKSKPGR